MKECQIALLQLLSKALFRKEIHFKNFNGLELLKEAKQQAVVQLAESVLDKSLLSIEEKELWEQAASSDIVKSIRAAQYHCQLHEWMTGIPYVILKGVASAYYYPIPSYRSMGDVDFLVRREYLERAGKILEEQTLSPWGKEHICHIVYKGPNMHYEMHFDLAGVPNGATGDMVREYIKDIFERSQEKAFGSGKVMLPSPFHHGLILLLHMCHHMTGEGIGLRHLCDWAVFENSLTESEFCNLFEEKLKSIGLWRFAQILTRTVIKYLGANERIWAINDTAIVDAIMEDILAGGNFGNKDKSRTMQAMLISNRGKDGVGRNSMRFEFARSINTIVCQHWPVARKYKLILPLGWVFVGSRRIIREITGKRKRTDVKGLICNAEKRRLLYAQLHLYEAEL